MSNEIETNQPNKTNIEKKNCISIQNARKTNNEHNFRLVTQRFQENQCKIIRQTFRCASLHTSRTAFDCVFSATDNRFVFRFCFSLTRLVVHDFCSSSGGSWWNCSAGLVPAKNARKRDICYRCDGCADFVPQDCTLSRSKCRKSFTTHRDTRTTNSNTGNVVAGASGLVRRSRSRRAKFFCVVFENVLARVRRALSASGVAAPTRLRCRSGRAHRAVAHSRVRRPSFGAAVLFHGGTNF
jgi:hypothetical protein